MRKILHWSLVSARLAALVGFGLVVGPRLAATPQFSESQVWSVDEDGYESHFVYGLGVTAHDTVIAACEGRWDGSTDGGNKDLLIKRSTDHGATWGADIVVEGTGNTLTYSNPAFVVDGTTLYFFYNWDESASSKHLYYRTSTDDGVTWSARTEISSLWTGNTHGWVVKGSLGHGIKKLKGEFKNTLYLAVAHRTDDTTSATTAQYGVDVIAKDPGSSTWTIAGETPMSTAKGPGEPGIAERSNSDLVIIARNVYGSATDPHSRTAGDGGAVSWGNWANTTSGGLVGTSQVSGGLLRFSDTYHLFSYPNNPGSTTREDMSIAYSTDGGVNWTQKTSALLYNGASTYSDIARDSLGNIYCLYGRGGGNHNEGGGSVWVAKVNLEWVTGTAKNTIVVDNTDAGFSVTTGTWNTSSTTDGYYGTNYRWAPAPTPPAAAAVARWTPTIPTGAGGNYEVYIRWPALSNRPDAAPVTVTYSGGSASQNVNEQKEGGTWQYLGTYNFAAGTGGYVEIAASDAGSTIADAVMFQQQ